MVSTCPKICNICGGKVEYVAVEKVYGRKNLKYKTSGYCYHCKQCGALVGTHRYRPLEVLGLLANKAMSDMRQKAHNMFDKFWRNRAQRTSCYQRLAQEMGLPFDECHFGYFTLDQLNKAYSILINWWRQIYDH